MELPDLGCAERRTVVLLGAGATRGASFVEPGTLAPPLDRDFFRILQMSGTGRTTDGRALLDHVRDVYGPSLDIGMETVFSNLSSAETFHDQLHLFRGPKNRQPTRLIEAFYVVLPALLGETIGTRDCTYHAALAGRLSTTDGVISLNYDCVIDRALRSYAGARFSPARRGYGLACGVGTDEWRGRARGRAPGGSIRLLKLHGSLNWQAPGSPLDLRPAKDIYEPVKKGVIQPPLANKPVADQPFNSVWRGARILVRGAQRLIVVGYSMPAADGLVRTLLTNDLAADLDEVIVIEPDEDTQARHVELFTRSARKARVFAFDHLGEFHAVL